MILMAVAAIMVTMSAQAGKAVTGMRMEIGDSERDHAEYSSLPIWTMKSPSAIISASDG